VRQRRSRADAPGQCLDRGLARLGLERYESGNRKRGEYQATLKSLTGGAGLFTMEFDHYATAPPTLQHKLMETFKPRAED
jgi:hypothetical protein